MNSKKKNIIKQFQQKKVKRVENSEKKYNKEKRSKSDEAYIKGDYKSSVSLRSYGVKKALANGEKVSGYGDDYIDTKGMKRSNYVKKQNGENPYEAKYLYVGGKPNTITSKDGSKFKTRTRYLTDEEKESYENTGELYHKNYRKAKSYLDTERHEGGKFSDRLKTFDGNKIKWDGLETAKYNQKDGKHLQNLGHYAIGLGKDLIADPVVDFLKGVDRVESAITNGVYAGVEQLSNIADGKGATKDLIKDVVKHSLKESDETGWGTSSADNWRNMAKRNGAKISPLEDKILGATGFVADILNPIDLGGKVSNVLKGTAKGAKNALKGVSSATDVMSEVPGFVPKSLTDVRGKNFINKTNKSNGASDDVFFGLKTNKSLDNTQIDRRLNNAYDVAMSKREPIKTGRSKLDSFIARLDVSNIVPISEVNQNPMKTSNPMDIKFRRKGVSEESGMFPHKTHQFNVSGNTLEALDGKYRDVLTKQGDDLVDYIDNLPDREYDKVIDYIQKKDPELYETLMYESNVIDDTIDSSAKLAYETQEDKKFKEILKSENKRDIKINKQDGEPSYMAHEILEKSGYDFDKMYSDNLSMYKNISNRLPNNTKHFDHALNNITRYLEVLSNGNKTNRGELIKIVDELNKSYFGGNSVISKSVEAKDVKQFLEQLEKAIKDVIVSKVEPNKLNSVAKLQMYRPSLVDPNFNAKLKKRKEMLGYGKEDYLPRMKEIENIMKNNNGNVPEELADEWMDIISKDKETTKWWDEHKSLTPSEWDRKFPNQVVKEQNNVFDKLKEEYSKKDFNLSDVENYKQDLRDSLEFNEYIKSEFPYDAYVRQVIENKPELLIDKNQKQILQNGYMDYINNLKESEIARMADSEFGSNIKHVLDEDKILEQKRNRETVEKTEKQIKDDMAREYKEKVDMFRKTSKINYVNTKNKISIPKDKQTYKNILGNKNVKTSLSNLGKLINKELEFLGKVDKELDETYQIIRSLIGDNVRYLDELGVDRKVYFDRIKEYKLKAISTLQDKQISSITRKSGNKNIASNSALDKLGIKINNKPINTSVSSNLSADELQARYLFAQGAKTIDELFEPIGIEVAQRGDNISSKINKPNTYIDYMSDVINDDASEISNYISPELMAKMDFDKATSKGSKQTKIDGRTLSKKYTQTKDGYIPQIKEETPLDSFGKTTDEQLNLFDKLFESNSKAPLDNFDDMEFESDFEKFAYEDYMREHKSQEKKGLLAKKEEVERLPKTDEQVKSIEDKLKLLTETYGDVNLEKKSLDIDVPKNVDPETGEILSNQNKGIKEVFEELSNKGIDVTQQPPKEKPQNMDKNLYQKWINAWKKGVTIYNPGWHVQNFFQNKAQNYFALGNKSFMPQTDAKNILKTIQGKDAKSVNINGMSNNELAKLANDLGVIDSFGDDIQLAQNGIFGKIENSKPMQKLQEVEKNARLHHWLEQMKNGMTPEQASKSVNKYLYDYSKENKFDRAMKHVDPFWTFHKNNARMLTTSALEHPSRMNNIMRANRGLEGDIPKEYKQDEEAMYREYQDPTKTYTDHKDRQYNYLYNQDVFSDISDAIPLSQDSLVGKLNPLIQIALRTAKGEGKFGNKIVDSDKSIEDGWNELLYEDAGYNKVSSNVAIKDALLDVNPILPGLVETIDAINADKYKANNGGMPQEIADKRALNEWIKLITGHKGNWYRNTR